MLAELINIRRIDKAFSLASKSKDKEARDLCDKTYQMLKEGNLSVSPSVIEALLLRSFLYMEDGDFVKARQSSLAYLQHRKLINYFNKAECAYMDRYMATVLWISHGRREKSCLLKIRNNLSKESGVIRPTTLARFFSPDD